MAFQPLKRFDSLAECFAELAAEFPDRTTAANMIVEGGIARSTQPDAPTYLFRGENFEYPTTEAVLVRLRKGGIDADTLAGVERVRDDLEQRFNAWLASADDHPDPAHCRSYLQHYGFPLDGIDLTGSLKVAAFFAAWHGPRTQSSSEAGVGLICIARADRLSDGGAVEDVRDHPYALRPRAQHAYNLKSDRHPDLKCPETIETLGLKWFAFRVTEADRAKFASMTYLLETHFDHVGSWLCTAMLTHLKENGPLSAETAAWLADRIPPAPMTTKPAGRTPEGEELVRSVSPAEAGLVYVDADLRRFNAEAWSGRIR